MRILLVSHDFLPNHPAGTEIYTAQLGLELRARGHEVRLFTTEKDISRPNERLDRREWQGLVVHELVNNLFYRDFRETWDWAPAEQAFAQVLDAFEPDVVHVMHLLYLSTGCVGEASRRGIPVFYTLHDFWLQCPRFGQRVHADGEICHAIDFERCGTCLARLKFSQSPLQRKAARAIATVRTVSGLNLASAARRLSGRARPPSGGEPLPERSREFTQAMFLRDRALLQGLVPKVERFFAPSRFLRERFLEWGIPPEKIEYLTYGTDLAPFADFERSAAERVRIGFIGSLVPHKGPHLLLQAWNALPEDLRERGRLTLWGPKQHRPDYLRELEELCARGGARLAGRLEREEIPGALAETDLLVVPSTWFENSPLSIWEALASKTPILVSDLGGMAELCEEGRNGWSFRVGDAGHLAQRLESILRQPEQLASLEPGPVKGMEQSALEMEERYDAALEGRSR